MSGRVLGAATAQACSDVINYKYIATVVTQSAYVAPFPVRVTSIVGRPRVAGNDGSPVTFSFYKAPSGTADGSGTLLHSGSYDLKGTADTNQTLSLVPDLDSRTLAAGDSISVVLTGTATAAVGVVSITVEPVE